LVTEIVVLVTLGVMLVMICMGCLRRAAHLLRAMYRRSQGLCPLCGYDLRACPTNTCPECGSNSGHGVEAMSVDGREGQAVNTAPCRSRRSPL
jgi:predicted amidophosphoribosyltransferase